MTWGNHAKQRIYSILRVFAYTDQQPPPILCYAWFCVVQKGNFTRTLDTLIREHYDEGWTDSSGSAVRWEGLESSVLLYIPDRMSSTTQVNK